MIRLTNLICEGLKLNPLTTFQQLRHAKTVTCYHASESSNLIIDDWPPFHVGSIQQSMDIINHMKGQMPARDFYLYQLEIDIGNLANFLFDEDPDKEVGQTGEYKHDTYAYINRIEHPDGARKGDNISLMLSKPKEQVISKKLVHSTIKEGVKHDPQTNDFTFGWEKDEPSDIMDLVKTRKKISTKSGVEYYVAFSALPKDAKYSIEYKNTMKAFRDKLKQLDLPANEIDRMIDVAIEGFIDAYGKQLDNIGLIVTPKSNSILNKKMSSKLSELMPQARLVDDLFAKSMIDDIKINTEKIVGTPEQKEKTFTSAMKMLNRFKEQGKEFSLKRVHPKFRNLFGNFIKLSKDLDPDLLKDIQTKDVLVIDDFLTKGFTMKEINRILQNYKLSGTIINFVLVLQG